MPDKTEKQPAFSRGFQQKSVSQQNIQNVQDTTQNYCIYQKLVKYEQFPNERTIEKHQILDETDVRLIKDFKTDVYYKQDALDNETSRKTEIF